MGQTLYRKYRSRHLDEIIGQEHITTTLANSLKTGGIRHAYLFTGPHGVGKTSVARILAHSINDLPYSDDASHLDIIEIDAASNRRIDEIRDLRDKVHIAPTLARYKVYIIDEVHMLTKEAFNALLKTLEEPPAHVVFILATTEMHKLPETIVSRCLRFTFKPIEPAKVTEHLKAIAKKEKIKISDEALKLIAEHGRGSFRDSISLLDQLGGSGAAVSHEEIRTILGVAPVEAIENLLQLVAAGSPAELVDSLQELQDRGYAAGNIASQLGRVLRNKLISGDSPLPPGETTLLLKDLLDVPAAASPDHSLELALLEASFRHNPDRPSATPPQAPPAEEAKTTPKPAKPAARKPAQPSEVPPAPSVRTKPAQLDSRLWTKALTAIKQQHNTLYGVARMAVAELDGETLHLSFAYSFHQKRLNEAKNKKLIADIIHELTGRPVTVVCRHDATITPETIVELADSDPVPDVPPVESSPAAAAANPALDTISNIFGAAEVLES